MPTVEYGENSNQRRELQNPDADDTMMSNMAYSTVLDTEASDEERRTIEGNDNYDFIENVSLKEPCICPSQNLSYGMVDAAGNEGDETSNIPKEFYGSNVYEYYEFPKVESS